MTLDYAEVLKRATKRPWTLERLPADDWADPIDCVFARHAVNCHEATAHALEQIERGANNEQISDVEFRRLAGHQARAALERARTIG